MQKRLSQILILLITVGVFTAYYVWHPPLTGPSLIAAGGALLDTLTVLLIVTVAGGIGRALLTLTPLDTLSAPERVGIEGLTGFGVLGLVGLAMGVMGVFTQAVLWVALAGLGLVTGPFVFRYWRDTGRGLRDLAPHTRWTRFLAGLCLFWLGTAWIIAIMPPTAWDALMYHLVLPKRLLASGQLTAYSDSHYLGFPQMTEILFAWSMGLFGRDTVAALIHYAAGVFGLSITYGLITRFVSKQAGWLSAAFLLSGGGFWLAMTQEYVDLMLFALSAGVLSTLTAWRQDSNPRWLLLMGGLIGFAVSTKYTAALIAVAAVVALLVSRPRQVIQNGLRIGGTALLVYLPWGVRGYLQYGNPFYPYLFGGVNWSAERSAFFGGVGGGLLDAGPAGWAQIPFLPFMSTIVGMEGRVRYTFDSGLWLLTLAVLVVFSWRHLRDNEKSLATTAGLLLLPMLALWMITGSFSAIGAHARRVITVFPAFAALSVIAFEALPRWGKRPLNVARILSGLVAASFVFNAVGTLTDLLRYDPAWMLTLPSATADAPANAIITAGREGYIVNTVGVHYIALQTLDEQLPDGARVRLLFEPKPYYCPPTIICDPDALTDHWLHALTVDGLTPDEVMAQWREEVDAVLLWESGYTFYTEIEPYQPEANQQLPAALDEHMRLVWEDDFGEYALYTWPE